MGIDSYINLLNSLANSAATVWGFLLTVSLGTVAFVGSLKPTKYQTSLYVCIAYGFVVFSNYYALSRNFDRRTQIETVIETKAEQDPSFKQSLDNNQKIIDSYVLTESAQTKSHLFQLLTFLIVSGLILYWPYKSSKSDNG